MNGRQPQTISHPRFLGGKKRFEKPGASFGVNATTGITDGEGDPGVAELVMSFGSEFRAVTITGTYGDAATGWDGVACIQYQIEDDLLNLSRIHPHHAEIRRQIRNQLDILANQPT
jgi:hypothetical protein